MGKVKLIVVYIAMAVIFLLIEYLWIGVIAREFYRKELINLIYRDIRWLYIAPICFIYITGILTFAVLPSQKANSLTRALSLGSLLGLFAYGIYNLTNLMMLKNWPLSVVSIDLAWGTLLTCIISAIGFIVAQKFP